MGHVGVIAVWSTAHDIAHLAQEEKLIFATRGEDWMHDLMGRVLRSILPERPPVSLRKGAREAALTKTTTKPGQYRASGAWAKASTGLLRFQSLRPSSRSMLACCIRSIVAPAS